MEMMVLSQTVSVSIYCLLQYAVSVLFFHKGAQHPNRALTDRFVMDPRQLPPVPDVMVGDDGRYCFQSALWQTVFPHQYRLTTNYQQTDTQLVEVKL